MGQDLGGHLAEQVVDLAFLGSLLADFLASHSAGFEGVVLVRLSILIVSEVHLQFATSSLILLEHANLLPQLLVLQVQSSHLIVCLFGLSGCSLPQGWITGLLANSGVLGVDLILILAEVVLETVLGKGLLGPNGLERALACASIAVGKLVESLNA